MLSPVNRVQPLVALGRVAHLETLQELVVGDASGASDSVALAQLLVLLVRHDEHEGVQHASEVFLGQAAIVVVIKLVEGTSQILKCSKNGCSCGFFKISVSSDLH